MNKPDATKINLLDTRTPRRRQFLKMLVKSGVGTSILRGAPLAAGLMANRFAEADEANAKRVIFLTFPGGAPAGTWMPSNINAMNRSTQPYQSVASFCNFSLVDLPGLGASHFALGGQISPNTIDVQLANVLGASTPFSRMNLSIQTTSNDFISKKNGAFIKPIDDPIKAYQLFFGAASDPDIYAKRKSALDANLAGLNRIKSQLNSEEKLRFDMHAEALALLEHQLEQSQQSACNKPALPSSADAVNDIGKQLRLQIDIAIAALQCGLTNVASIQFSDSQAEWVYSGSMVGTHHNIAHSSNTTNLVEVTNYLGKNGAYLIERLLNTEDSSGKKLIDSTVFVQIALEGDIAVHTSYGAPAIVASRLPAFKPNSVGNNGRNIISLLNDIAKGLGASSITDFNTSASSGILV